MPGKGWLCESLLLGKEATPGDGRTKGSQARWTSSSTPPPGLKGLRPSHTLPRPFSACTLPRPYFTCLPSHLD